MLFDDSEDVVLAHDQILLTFNLDFTAGILAEQNLVAFLDIQWQNLAFRSYFAFTYRNDLAFLRLFLGDGVGDNNSRSGLGFLFHTLDNDTILQWSDLHSAVLLSLTIMLA